MTNCNKRPVRPNRPMGGAAIKAMLPVLLPLLLAGCASMAPEYERPPLPVPAHWPTAQAGNNAMGPAAAEIPWQAFIQEEPSRQLVALALESNRDLRVAALNIEKARQMYRISRADALPELGVSSAGTRQHTPASLSVSGDSTTTGQYQATAEIAAFELDFFGRIRSLNEQALQRYLATEEAQRAVQVTLVSDVLTAYVNLAADQALLRLARQTHETQRRAYALIQRSEALGAATHLDLRQAQTQVESARVDIAQYSSRVAEDRNALTALVGADIPDAWLPQAQNQAASVLSSLSAGLPSDVLLQRPDVLAAERRLLAANATIGAARAAFFPRITLTAAAGSASASLSDLFSGGSGVWQFLPQISLPIVDVGRLDAQLAVSETDQKIALAEYEKTIQTAFREVADVLARRSTLDEQLAAQQALVEASADYYRLSEARFNRGVDSYLTVLDAQRSLYAAEQALIRLRLTADSSNVVLYKALGGGWRSRTSPGGSATALQ